MSHRNVSQNVAEKIRTISGDTTSTKAKEMHASSAKAAEDGLMVNTRSVAKSKKQEKAAQQASKVSSKQQRKKDQETEGTVNDKDINTNLPDEAWKCKVCEKESMSDNTQMMECEKCRHHFCLDCIGMNEQVYCYMAKDEVIWCCRKCVYVVRSLMDEEVDSVTHEAPKRSGTNLQPGGSATGPDPFVMSMRKDLDDTMNCMKTMVKDFYEFIQGPGKGDTKAKETSESEHTQPKQSGSRDENCHKSSWVDPNENPWQTVNQIAPITKPAKTLKDIMLEAHQESIRDAEDEERRKRSIIIHRAPESSSKSWEERKDYNEKLVNDLLEFLEVQAEVDICHRLGRKKEVEAGQDDVSKRPLKVSFKSERDTEAVLKSLYKMRDAPDELNLIRVSPDRNLKEREELRKRVQQAKNLTAQETGDFMHVVRGKDIIRVRRRKTRNAAAPEAAAN